MTFSMSVDECYEMSLKPEMYNCSWPFVPPLCEATWAEFPGEGKFDQSTLLWIFIMLMMLLWPGSRLLRMRARVQPGGWSKFTNTMDHVQVASFMNIFLNLVTSIDFGSFNGVLPPSVYFVLKRFRAAFLYIMLYLLTRSWYLVIQEKSNRLIKTKIANRIFYLGVFLTCSICFVAPIISIAVVSEEFSDSGTFNGYVGAAERFLITICLWFLLLQVMKIGLSIHKKLHNSAAGKTSENKGNKESKILKYAKVIFCCTFPGTLYLIRDAMMNMKEVSFVETLPCEPKVVFFRIGSITTCFINVLVLWTFKTKEVSRAKISTTTSASSLGKSSATKTETNFNSVDEYPPYPRCATAEKQPLE